MVDTGPLDLANFLARNRAAGGVNAQLAEALSANLAPQAALQGTTQQNGPVLPGLFGVGREPGARSEFGVRDGIPVGGERRDIGFPTNALLGALFGGPVGAFGGFARDVFTAPLTRSLTGQQARSIQDRADREDRRSNRDLREGRGSGASPRRGDTSNAGR